MRGSHLLVALGVAGCANHPDARVEDTLGVRASGSSPNAGVYSANDVRFFQRMIHHHAQALKMSELARTRARSLPVRLLAERISLSQGAEIDMMRRWLREGHQLVPDSSMARQQHDSIMSMPDTGAASGLMPGMLTSLEMSELAHATAASFDRLFLAGMVRHHQGAVAMVADLLHTPGAGENAEVFQLASEIDSGQRAEIERMRALLAVLATDASAAR